MQALNKRMILLLLILIPVSVPAQKINSAARDHYRTAIKNFYHLLFTNDSMSVGAFESVYGNGGVSYDSDFYYHYKDSAKTAKKPKKKPRYNIDTAAASHVFGAVRQHLADITYKANEQKVDSIIDEAEIYHQGYEFLEVVELSFGKKKKVYVEISVDTPYQILFLWLTDGSLFEDVLLQKKWPEKLLLAGTVDPLVGEAEIRDRARMNSNVIGKIRSSERYYFIPGGMSDWWAVCPRDDMRSAIGYVYFSYIVKYPYVPGPIRKRVEKERTMLN